MSRLPRLAHAAVLGVMMLLGPACGTSPSPGPPSNNPPGTNPPGSFAGIYTTHVTLTQDGCGDASVGDNLTGVTHDVATGAITLTHVSQTYAGTIKADNTFTTTPRNVIVGDGFVYLIAISGQFRTSAFDADVTVDRSAGSVTCRYLVHWAGALR